MIIRKYLRLSGFVQGVGFRYRAKYAAGMAEVTGWVRNDPDGAVSMELQGREEEIDKVLLIIQQGNYIDIQRMEAKSIPVIEDERGFHIEY